MNEDDMAAMDSALDQMSGYARSFALAIISYYRTLRESGIDKDHALPLTMQYQTAFLANIYGSGNR